MPRPSSAEALLDRLAALRRDPAAATNPAATEVVAQGLASRVGFVAAKAADVAVELRLSSLATPLIEAFVRFTSDPRSPDAGCEARKAIVRALLELAPAAPGAVERVFLPGVRVSCEAVQWNGTVEDPGAAVRGFCAIGLVAAGYRDSLVVAADLLADRYPAARVGAARALGHSGQDAAALMLRLKLTLTDGDEDPDAAAECMAAMVRLWPARSLDFVASFLRHARPGNRDAAALALGASRQPAAAALLRARLDVERDPDVRRVLMTALATMRLPEAVDCLIGVAGAKDEGDAVAAVEALAIYRRDERVRARLTAAVAGNEQARRALERVFGK